MSLRRISLLTNLLLSLPAVAHAQNDIHRSVIMTTGVRIPLSLALSNFYGFLAATVVSLCTLIFVAGAASLVLSRGDQTKVDNGKKMMIGSLTGLAIALSAYAILRTVLFFLYEGS